MPRMKSCLIAAAVLLVACGPSGRSGGTADAKGPAATEKKLTLAGLAIGMSVPQATAVLKSAGWQVVTNEGYTWEQNVNNELANQNVAGRKFDYRMKGVGMLIATKGDERVAITFRSAPAPALGRIREASYTAPAPGQTPQQMIAGLAGRYGPPDRPSAPGFASGAGATWCVGGAACASGRGFGTRTFLLGGQGSIGGGGLNILLSEGTDASEAWQAELLRAAGVAGGARGKPSY